MRPRAGSRVIVEGDGAPWIPIDAALEQGLTSLLNNAADASDCEIEVRLAWNEAALTIVIEDRGPGFPAEVLRDAGRAPLSAREGGAGIGLLLAFSAVERLGGRIALANRPGGGACVSIELPVARNTGS
jgi:two-component system sensor histidine kinase RegB